MHHTKIRVDALNELLSKSFTGTNAIFTNAVKAGIVDKRTLALLSLRVHETWSHINSLDGPNDSCFGKLLCNESH